MHKSVTLDQVTFYADGSVAVEWKRQIIDDDGTSLATGDTIRAHAGAGGDILAEIDATLASLAQGRFTIGGKERARLSSLVESMNGLFQADEDVAVRRAVRVKEKTDWMAEVRRQDEARAAELAASIASPSIRPL
jgi:hypothetical protein